MAEERFTGQPDDDLTDEALDRAGGGRLGMCTRCSIITGQS